MTETTSERLAKRRAREQEAREAVAEIQGDRKQRDNRGALAALITVGVLAAGSQFLVNSLSGPANPAAQPANPANPAASASPVPTPAGEVPPASLSEQRTWTGDLTVNDVKLGVEYDGAKAPQGVAVAVSLAKKGFYANTPCHRLVTQGIFVLQCGDPTGTGTGGPGFNWGPVENAPANDLYPAGTIAMARQGGKADSQGSQFFLVTEDSTIPHDAAGGYTVLGKVTSGLDELKAKVTSQGTADGQPDGKPKVDTKITGFTLK